MNKFRNISIALGLLLAAWACGHRQPDTSLADKEIIPVVIMPLVSKDTAQSVSATGTFTTDDETVLSFKNGGAIQQIQVKEGDAFKRGQLLASLEPTEINTAVKQSQLALEKAERDYKRARQLYLDSVATKEQMENAQTALELAKQDAERAAYNLGHTGIRAAFDGYVLQRPANAGQIVGPGTPVLVVSGTGRSGWLLKVGVGDRQWAAIQVGDGATVTSDAIGKPIQAEVYRKSEGIDPQSGTFTIYLKLKLAEAPLPTLASGMFGKAEIRLASKQGAWLIPYEALLDGDAGSGYVFVTDDGKMARRVPVQVGGIQKDHIMITRGLEHAQSLIVSGSPYLRDGSAITVK
ncbi:efflux RND transporter periplasmic adaptor subunit [Parapedobacter koreensis]|uniref:RND family efflux transporter, MFP subunit n=1 Tax=Parapedobacter koreensis TaxID=332977 RepID=A0A1H7LBH7_9SPHI|nr:efflux RND transporter periplasmic adaptor subunit [Parapedobacter koreensis]SEK96228.1 RND family efflux transporter, MFP subunit [Parapedobacter koreensis]